MDAAGPRFGFRKSEKLRAVRSGIGTVQSKKFVPTAWGGFRLATSGHRDILHRVSTAELKRIIDQRTPEERQGMTSYLLDRMFSVPELRQTAEELSRLEARRTEMVRGAARIAEAHSGL
jgi:hypothetical protein